MDAWMLPVVLNVVLGIIAYLGKMQIENMRQLIKELQTKMDSSVGDLHRVRQEYLHKEDFRDFKNELYERMDRNHQDLIRQITKAQ